MAFGSIFWRYFSTPFIFLWPSQLSVINFLLMTDSSSFSSSGVLASVFKFYLYLSIFNSGNLNLLADPLTLAFSEKLFFFVRFLLEKLCFALRSSLSSFYLCHWFLSS